MPSWEEIYNTANKDFYSLGYGITIVIEGFCYPNNDERTIKVYQYNGLMFEKPLTKENYIDACRLCKQLFLGEKE